MIAPASDLPLLKVKKLSRGRYYHLWLWSLYFRLSLETGLEIPEEKWAHWGNYQLQKTKYHYQSPRNKAVSDKLIPYRTLSSHGAASWQSYGSVAVLTLVRAGRPGSCRAQQCCCDRSIVAPTCFPRGTWVPLLIQHHSSGHHRSFSFTVQPTVPPNAGFVRSMTLPSALQSEPMGYTC